LIKQRRLTHIWPPYNREAQFALFGCFILLIVLLVACREQFDDTVEQFADANSLYRPDAIAKLVRNFADPQVGYVTGSMRYVSADGSMVGDGCSAYMRYENALRLAETRLGSIVGVDGGVDAIRRNLYQPMRADQLPDFVAPLSVAEQGFRVIYEPDAVLTEETLSVQSQEYRMRVRVALRAFWALWDKRTLLNPFRFGLYAWQLWSHKLLRYLSFVPLAAAMALNWVLLPQPREPRSARGCRCPSRRRRQRCPLQARFAQQ